jgi:hypothetical protein
MVLLRDNKQIAKNSISITPNYSAIFPQASRKHLSEHLQRTAPKGASLKIATPLPLKGNGKRQKK